jgi:hypothetical protein
MNHLTRSKPTTALFFIMLALVCFGLLPNAQAVVPPPDGSYPGGNTAEGQAALLSLTTGGFNTAVGFLSLRSSTTNSFNTAIGAGTLLANTADQNTAVGAGALLSNTTGNANTANGAFALLSNTIGIANTANGFEALFSNTTGVNNTANGFQALYSNTTGIGNTATGFDALTFNTGYYNTAIGDGALFGNTTGNDNTATGFGALTFNTTGVNNAANGAFALVNNTTGNDNTALGIGAGTGVTTANNVICVGPIGGANVDNTTWIGNIYATSTVSGTTLPVIVSDTGQLGTASSSRRFKKEIKPMGSASEAILAFRPVTFHYKSDSTDTPQFGLIAEQVADVNPDLVVRDKNGEIYTVRYDVVNAMLLNEFLKEHRKIEEQEGTIAELKSSDAQQQREIAALTATVKEQAAQIQKVSAQVEMNKPATRMALNHQ